MTYCTAEQAKSYLGITTTTDDVLIWSLIEAAQASSDLHTHRTFEASADTERTFDAVADVHGAVLDLDKDLCAITSITNGDGTTVTAAQYVTEPRNGTPYNAIKIRSDADIVWTYTDYHEDAITIDGRWAYSTTAPDDIGFICQRYVAWLYRQRENRTGDDDRTIIAGNATLLPSTIPADIQAALRPYVRRL